MVGEPDATMQPAPQDNQLMSKHRVLSFKPYLRLERRGQDGENETEQPDHSASLGDSIASSTRIRFSVHTGDPGGPLTELDANRVPRHTGRDVDNAAPNDADHHMKCPGCGLSFDMRDLAQVVEHIHDSHIEVLEPPPREFCSSCSIWM
jgi:hypothetical protein